jgi:Fic family protein
MTSDQAKEALKTLRQQRKESVDQARKIIKERNQQILAIKSHLENEPQTIPEMAALLGMESATVLIVIAALRKYGEVTEDVKDGDYYKYRLVLQAAS